MLTTFRRLRVFIVVAVLGLGLWSLFTLRLQTELFPLFPSGLHSVQVLKKAEADFSSSREILAVAAPGTNPGWVTLGKMAAQIGGRPGIDQVQMGPGSEGSAALWLAGQAASLPPAQFAALREALTPEQVTVRLQSTLSNMAGAVDETELGRLRLDPLQLNALIFPPGTPDPFTRALDLPPVLTLESSRSLRTFEDDQRFVAQARQALDAAARDLALRPAPQFLLTGEPAITADIASHMRRDIIVMLAFTLALTSLAFWLTYRSLMPLLWIIVAQLLAVLCALVVARLIFAEINVLSLGFSSILLGVGMDYCILVYHFFAQPGEIDAHQWKELRRAILLSAVTTAATFGVLYFSSFPGLRQLAVLVGSGLLATAFFATTFLADLLQRRRPHAPRWLEPASDRCARFMSRHRVAFRLATAAIISVTVLLAPRLAKFPFYDSGVEQLEPSQLESYRAQKILQAAAPKAEEKVNAANADRNRSAWNTIDPATLRREFSQAGLDTSWAASTVQLVDALNRWHAGSLDLTGPSEASQAWVNLRTELNRTAVLDFRRLSLFMLAIVVALCAAAHRSFRLVGLNLTALALALLLLALGLYASQTSMTILSLLCIPLMIGLVIDYSLHIVLALEHAGGNLVEAARHLAVPVLLTGTASLIGFSAPMLSSQPSLQNFGNVMDLGTIAAVVSGLVLLPALYRRLRLDRPSDPDTTHHLRALYRALPFEIFSRLAHVLPLGFTRTLAGIAGWIYAWTHPAKVRVVHCNLQLLRRDLPLGTARRVYAEFGRTMADYFYIGTRPAPRAVKIIRQIDGVDHLHAARRLGKGALIVTAHLGLFELGGLLMGCHGLATAALTFPEPSSELTSWRAAFRRRWGTDTVEIGTDAFAFLEIARRLQRQEFVATLVDRPHPRESVSVRLPAGKSGFSTGILLLAAQTGTPVIVATMVRAADGFYCARVSAPIFIHPQADRRATLEFYSQQIADFLLPDLCAYPEQWYQFVPLSPSP